MNVVNQVNSPVTKAIDEVLTEMKKNNEGKDKQRVLFNVDSEEDDDNNEQF